jgi:hypothetical protein
MRNTRIEAQVRTDALHKGHCTAQNSGVSKAVAAEVAEDNNAVM